MKILETDRNWRTGLSDRSRTDYIALHHAAAVTCTAAQVDEWHKSNGWSGIGYHFFVRKDGSIYRGRPLSKVGAHVSGMNHCSVGICAEGDYDRERTMPAAQMAALKELLRYLKQKYPSARIVGHREIGASDCPGRYYPLEELKSNYEEEIDIEELKDLRSRVAELKALMAAQGEKYDLIINRMGTEIDSLKKTAADNQRVVYDYIDDNMPDWARPTVQRLVRNGILKGGETGKLGLTHDMLRQLVILDRAGLF